MKKLLFLLIFTLPLFSQAQSLADFKGESRTITQSLLSQGIKRIGNIDIEVLDRQISETKWESVHDKFLIGSGEGRATSIYVVEQKTVIVNELALKLIDRSVYPQVSLHEAFGAQGYDDEKSNVSLALEQIARNPKNIVFFEKHLKNSVMGLKTNKVYQSKGGGTSVGGGGDGTAIEFKKILLDIALQDSSAVSDNVIASILNSDIEPNWHVEQMHDLKVQAQGESFRIDIPSVLWITYGFDQVHGPRHKVELARAVFNKLFASKR